MSPGPFTEDKSMAGMTLSTYEPRNLEELQTALTGFRDVLRNVDPSTVHLEIDVALVAERLSDGSIVYDIKIG